MKICVCEDHIIVSVVLSRQDCNASLPDCLPLNLPPRNCISPCAIPRREDGP